MLHSLIPYDPHSFYHILPTYHTLFISSLYHIISYQPTLPYLLIAPFHHPTLLSTGLRATPRASKTKQRLPSKGAPSVSPSPPPQSLPPIVLSPPVHSRSDGRSIKKHGSSNVRDLITPLPFLCVCRLQHDLVLLLLLLDVFCCYHDVLFPSSDNQSQSCPFLNPTLPRIPHCPEPTRIYPP